jgi:hypothetical protein
MMTERERQALSEALISLGVSLAGVVAMLLLMRHWAALEHRAWQFRQLLERSSAQEGQALAQTRSDISKMEHGKIIDGKFAAERWGEVP